MRTPAFWDVTPPNWQAKLLQPFGWLYGFVTARRMAGQGRTLTVPVICVGNLTAGGAGKTPSVIWLARRLSRHGRRPVILSRGHGGALHGPVVVDPARHIAADVGDEPLLLARIATVVVARDRSKGADLALQQGADCLIMDDGLQNPALAKTLRLAVVDGASGFGNGLCVPAGPLRAPPKAQWPFIDHLLVIGAGSAGEEAERLSRAADVATSSAHLEPDVTIAAMLNGRQVLAISGIGRPDKFHATLAAIGAIVADEQRFADHVAYTPADVDRLAVIARDRGLLPVTTEKDAVKLNPLWDEPRHGLLAVLPVSLTITDETRLEALLAGIFGAPA